MSISLPSRAAKRRTEQTVLAEVRVALNAIPRVRVWRNNVGEIHEPKRHLIYGLAPGSADLIGIAHGRFLSIECKHPNGGTTTAEQRRWAEVVRELGGIALENIHSAEEAKRCLMLALHLGASCPCESEIDEPGPHIAVCPYIDPNYDAP